MPLRVYNTLSQTKEPFNTVAAGKVGMYVCGPTVYSKSHIGHMVGPVIFDTIKRYLVYLGYRVTWVVNITDVDDKLIVQAQQDGTTVKELAERVTRDYLDCLEALGVARGEGGIDEMPRATEHIAEIIEITAGLIDKGFAYPSGGDVYFDVTRAADYGKLSHRDPEELVAGARIEASTLKRNPGDFALWKSSKPGEPSWESPWGPGRPGWHIECSAMSMRYLLKAHAPDTLRALLLSSHYRRPIDYGPTRLEEIERGLQTFYRAFERFEELTGKSFYTLEAPTRRDDVTPAPALPAGIAEQRQQFLEAMDDDFNTGGALGELFEIAHAVNRMAATSVATSGDAPAYLA